MNKEKIDYIDMIVEYQKMNNYGNLLLMRDNSDSISVWYGRLNDMKKSVFETIRQKKIAGFITQIQYEREKVSMEHHFDMCVNMVEYLLSSEYNQVKFVDVLNKAFDELPLSYLSFDNPGIMIYDPIMRKILFKILTGDALIAYKKLVDKLDEKIKRRFEEKKVQEKVNQIKYLKEKCLAKIRDLIIERWTFKNELIGFDALVNKFFDSIEVTDVINMKFDVDVISNFMHIQKIIEEKKVYFPKLDDGTFQDVFQQIFGMSLSQYEQKLKKNNELKNDALEQVISKGITKKDYN